MSNGYKTLLVERKDRVAILRMNRPKSMNALERELRVDLLACLRDLTGEENVGAVILTGSGKAFCAGGDLRELREGMPLRAAVNYVRHVSGVIAAIKNLGKPVLAAVNGSAMGAGFSMVMACDLIIASEAARFSLAFVNVGLIPDLGSTYFAPRLLGPQKAKELALTGKTLGAHELSELGVINAVVAPEMLENHTLELADQISQGPPLAMRFARQLLDSSWNYSLDDALQRETEIQAACMQTADHREGIAAFYEKRSPRFRGQ